MRQWTTWRGVLAVAAIVPWVSGCSDREGLPAADGWTIPADAEIQRLLAERLARNGVGIVVGVIDADGPRVVAAGRTGADDDRPLDGTTIFEIGSVTKVVTTLLLADLVAKGEVGLDDAASDLLPAGTDIPVRGRPITLRDLATHTSGLPSMPTNFDLAGEPNPYEAYTVDELYGFLSSYEPERPPGEAYAYSNLGVALLGRLLGNRMGVEYEALLRERILQPLGMTDSGIGLTTAQERRVAPGHSPYLAPIRSWEMSVMPASGSLRSTAEDMLTLIGAYLGYVDSPLSQAMELQLTEGVEVNGETHVLGWGRLADGTYRHAGGKAGYRSGVAFNRSTGLGAVVLANSRTEDQPIDLAVHLVTGAGLDPAPRAPQPKRVVPLSARQLDRFVGSYEFPDGRRIDVARMGAGLVMRYENQALYEFMPMGDAEFFYDDGNDDVVFGVGSSGLAESLTRYGDGLAAGSSETATRVER